MQLAVLCVTIIVSVLLGLLVYIKNPKSLTNRLFLMLTASFIIWSIINYFSLHPVVLPQLYWIRLVLFAAAPLCLFVYLTFTVFPASKLEKRPIILDVAVLATLFVMALTQTPLIFSDLKVENGVASPQPGPAIGLFVVLVICLLGGGLWNLISKLRRSSGHQKEQIRLVLFGIIGTFGLIFLTNFVFVVAFGNSSFIALGPAYTLIFSGALAYAIVKHKLFDIRRTVTRALAYILTIGSLVLVYSIIVLGLTTLIFGQQHIERSTQIIFTIAAIVLALSFQQIKIFFDRFSNKFFYRDAYDGQDVINTVNSTLVKTIDLESVLASTASIIESELKVSYADFYLDKDASIEFHLAGSNTKIFASPDWQKFYELFDAIDEKTLVPTHNNVPDEIAQLMSSLEIECAVKMTTNNEDVGLLLVGARKSGNLLLEQDIQLLEIIADEVAIAVKNALQFKEIRKFNITLQEKVETATRQLRRSNDKLKQLDETKDEFISMASHQLRTPLTSVKGYVSMVLEGDAGDITPMQRKLLDQAFVSSQRMVYLIADLLNVSRLKTGKFIIEKIPTNLADVVEGEISQLRETAKSRDLELTYEKPKDFPVLNLDETKIRQVIMNFADNAIYYTPAGGHIRVELHDKPDSVEYLVIDDGIGVPKSEQHHLFTKFYRAGNARKARPDGTGLGLFMAKKVIVASGGALIFKSQPGKGSTFGFSFPKKALAVESTPEK